MSLWSENGGRRVPSCPPGTMAPAGTHSHQQHLSLMQPKHRPPTAALTGHTRGAAATLRAHAGCEDSGVEAGQPRTTPASPRGKHTPMTTRAPPPAQSLPGAHVQPFGPAPRALALLRGGLLQGTVGPNSPPDPILQFTEDYRKLLMTIK